jgi:hypothetical protein
LVFCNNWVRSGFALWYFVIDTIRREYKMSKQTIISIDPGVSGGIAWRDKDKIVHAIRMPTGLADIADQIRSIVVENKISIAVMEKTGTYMPGNSGPGAVTFARHCGNLEAILYTLGISTKQVSPQKWQKCLGALPKDKKERKQAIKEWVARRHPELTVTLPTADALAILECSEKLE